MSKADAERLVYEVKKNPQLRADFRKGGPAEFESIAKSAGFDCTKDEYAEVVKHAILDRESASTLAVTAGLITSAVQNVL